MNRAIKNIITIILLLITSIFLAFTIFQNNNTKENHQSTPPNQMKEPTYGKEPNPMETQNPLPNEPVRPEKQKENKSHILTFAVASLFFSLVLIYWIMSNFHKKSVKETFQNQDKITIGILSVLLITTLITCITAKLENKSEKMNFQEEKETKKEDVENGTQVQTKNIHLSDYQSNITIKEGGTYTVTGTFTHSIVIASDSEIELKLNNVTIENANTAAIINKSQNALTIYLEENSINYLTDGGSSEYDACIYSEGPLTIDGTGSLYVKGRQTEGEGIATETNDITIQNGIIDIESVDDGLNAGGDGGKITINGGCLTIRANGDGIDSNKNLQINGGVIFVSGSPMGADAAIDTEDGYLINGGTIIALGSDMLETPLSSSTQTTMCFQLEEKIPANTQITLTDDNNNIILSFQAKETFQTLILSSNKLNSGNYYLYKDGTISSNDREEIKTLGTITGGTKIKIQNQETFTITNKINKYGQMRR